MTEHSGVGEILTNTTRRVTSVIQSCTCEKGVTHKMRVPVYNKDDKIVDFFQMPVQLICVYCGSHMFKEFLWEDIPNA